MAHGEPRGFLRSNAPWLGAGAMLTFCSSFGQTYFIAIFAGHVRADFGLSHGDWGAIYAVGTLGSAVAMIWAGALVDRVRIRTIGAATLGILAGACLFMAAVPTAWALILAVFALRFAGQGMTSHVATTAMARWFVAARGRALAVATLGFAVGEALLPLGFVAAMTVVPWRSLWVAAALIALLAIPLLLRLLVRERVPRGDDGTVHVAGLDGRHWLRRDVLSHPLFWCAMPAILGPPAFVTALFFQQVHLAEVKGWTHVELVSLFPLYTAAGIAGLLTAGWAIDRFGTDRLMPLVQLPLACGFVIFAVTDSLFGAAFALCAVAMTVGANSTVPTAFWAEFYGTRHLGAIRALGAAVMVFGTALGPALTGYLIDAGLPIDDQMPWYAGLFVATSGLLAVSIHGVRDGLPRMRPV